MKCIVVTPEKTLVDEDAKFIVAPLFDGEYGIDADHAPVVGRLGVGEMRLTLVNDSVQYWFIDGGILEVVDNVATFLTNRACPISDLNVGEARKAIEDANRLPMGSLAEVEIRTEALARANAQLKAAEKAHAMK